MNKLFIIAMCLLSILLFDMMLLQYHNYVESKHQFERTCHNLGDCIAKGSSCYCEVGQNNNPEKVYYEVGGNRQIVTYNYVIEEVKR